ncbi:MAG TPA: hypothetical protein VGJ73_22630 [Verrucomicrobiae bacterium]|jgi:hypothetical protein
MKTFFIVFFGILFVLALALWVIGSLTAVVVPWFGGARADHIGAIGMGLASIGESATFLGDYLLFYLIDKPEKRKNQAFGLPGPKRYGNRKSAV